MNATRSGMQRFHVLIIITDNCLLCLLRFAVAVVVVNGAHYYDYYENANEATLPVARRGEAQQLQIQLQAFIIINMAENSELS